ncbi:nickel pincer cofactor biosynthesis protein LarC [Thermogemmatispora sp.]|uniref:nickel pincer cofactor biosynthesis protein LarC n=1 Tax=Thermogemmatispora sp. TaxID=1968838 RepID=UPI001E17F9D2|nr:nickel pincer cofactor biosynthesis protein LarC [Thermogemmatispora sp.]MBX5451817.1 nickel pincer cofactor biosynthesis protein LarC [Thermogemmatispora sp.]
MLAYLDCYSGISGNMFIGAMLDAGLSWDSLQQMLALLPVRGYQLRREALKQGGIQGQRFEVVLEDPDQPERRWSEIRHLLESAPLPTQVRERALAIFRTLAEAEASVHGVSPEEVHFHEVGAIDAIVDIVGAAIAVEVLGIKHLYASPLPLTTGMVETAHGWLPVPAPATLEILRRVAAPWRPCPVQGELVTPTGAAILATLARFEMPAMRIERVGYGFGHRHLPWPNCLRLCLGPAEFVDDATGEALDRDWVTLIETNLDNTTPELLGALMDELLTAGALDVTFSPLQMKKNRPGTLLSVLALPEQSEQLATLILRSTGTLGLRLQQMQRLKAQRSQEELPTPLGTVTVKVKRLGARIVSATPEYESCRRLAQEHGVSLSVVYDLVQQCLEADFYGQSQAERPSSATSSPSRQEQSH